VAVARHHLRRGRFGAEPQLREDLGLEVGGQGRIGADRAGDGAGSGRLAGGGQPPPVPVEGERVAGQLEPEGGRLGRDPVGAAEAEGVAWTSCTARAVSIRSEEVIP
jgi:hypothetical protein